MGPVLYGVRCTYGYILGIFHGMVEDFGFLFPFKFSILFFNELLYSNLAL